MSVRPDYLLVNLAAYQHLLPSLTTFRLCHAFGSGPDDHVNKLPVELRVAIEKLYIDVHITYGYVQGLGPRLSEIFCCFEDRCQPSDHAPYFNDRLLDWEDEIGETIDLCNDCAKEGFPECAECDRKLPYGLNLDMVRNYKG